MIEKEYKCLLYDSDPELHCALSMFECPIDKYNMFNDKHKYITMRRLCESGKLKLNWTQEIIFHNILKEFFKLNE